MCKKFLTFIILVIPLLSCAEADMFTQRDLLGGSIIDQAQSILLHNASVFELKLTEAERNYEDGDTGLQKISPFVTNKICAKDKTIVIGASDGGISQFNAEDNNAEKFGASSIRALGLHEEDNMPGTFKTSSKENIQPCYFVTEDPAFVFAGGVHVGSDVKDLEEFIGASRDEINNFGDNEKIIWGSSEVDYSDFYTFYLNNDGKISRVEFWIYLDDVPITKRTIEFAVRTASRLKIPVNFESLEKLADR